MPNIHETPDWEAIHARAAERMAQVDALDAESRALVYEFNTNAVVAAFQKGYRTPQEIRSFLTRMQGHDAGLR